ncbi:MAG: hypothetical protein IJZ94_01210 [Clostridia bacterium]|nr:hypothetical protein [Clostridia bacterium]
MLKLFTNVKFYYSVIVILLIAVTATQIYLKVTDKELSYAESGMAFDKNNIQAAASVTEEFGKDRGMISLKCSDMGSGGVYVYVNNTMKANITSTELKNLKVKKGDVIIVKGHSLQSNVTVTIESAVGNIDTEIAGKSVTLGNLGKYLVSIK